MSILQQMHNVFLQKKTSNVFKKEQSFIEERLKEIKGATQKEEQKIQKYLNNLFYPKEINSDYNQLIAKTEEFLSNLLGKRINNFNFSLDRLGYSKGTEPIEIIAEYESFQHKNYIERSTLECRLKEVKLALEKPNLTGEQIDSLQILERKIATDLLSKTPSFMQKNDKAVAIYKAIDHGELITAIDLMFQENSFYKNINVQSWIKGQVFEKALDFFSQKSKEGIDMSVDDILKSVFSKKQAGSNLVQRTPQYLESQFGLELTSSELKNNSTAYFYKTSEDKNIKISGAFSDKQGKMDIEFNLPQGDFGQLQQLRASAKNWSVIDEKHDFGESDLQSILLRTINIDGTLYIGFLEKYINSYRLSSIIENYLLGREILKQSIFLDTVMGFSQRTGYADFLIVNDRSNSSTKIKVYSIKRLFDRFKKMHNAEKYIKGFADYNAKSFKNVIFENNNDISFITTVLEEFKKYKVAIYATLLKA